MTSVPFELNVTITTETGKKEQYGEVAFRFTTKSARALERAAGSGLAWVIARGQSVEALVLLVCYGLQHLFPKMTEAKATDLIDAFIDRGGDVAELSKAAHQALNASGVYGKPEGEGDARPTTASLETAAT